MTTRPDANIPGRASLSERDRIVAELFARYIQRRHRGEEPHAHDLLAAAAEHGDTATDVLRVLLASYDATRARNDPAHGRRDTSPEISERHAYGWSVISCLPGGDGIH
jgi:hypothetical protein